MHRDSSARFHALQGPPEIANSIFWGGALEPALTVYDLKFIFCGLNDFRPAISNLDEAN